MKRNAVFFVLCGLLAFLLLACGTEEFDPDRFREDEGKKQAELVISNQSSAILMYVTYCGKQIMKKNETGGSRAYFLIAEEGTEIFDEDKKGYLFFRLEVGTDLGVDVRTSDMISIEKGKKKICTITDNTFVVPIGEDDSCRIITLIQKLKRE